MLKTSGEQIVCHVRLKNVYISLLIVYQYYFYGMIIFFCFMQIKVLALILILKIGQFSS